MVRKILRDLRARRVSLLALLIILGFGIGGLVGFWAVYFDLRDATREYYSKYRLADFVVEMKRAPAQVVAEAEQLPNVRSVRGRVSIAALIDLPGSPEPISGQAISLAADRHPILNDVELTSGMWFSGPDARETILTEGFAKANGLVPGMKLKILLLDKQEELLIVGTAISPEFIYLIAPGGGFAPDPARFGMVYVPQRFLQESSDLDGAFNQLLVQVDDRSGAKMTETMDIFDDTFDEYGVALTSAMDELPSGNFVKNEQENIRKSSMITPVVFLSVAALLLNVLVARLVAQQRGVIGTLKAIGYSRGDIVRHYLAYGVVLGIAGGIIGVVLGTLIHFGMLTLYRSIFALPSIPFSHHAWLHGIGFVVSMISAVLGTISGVRAAAKLEPAEAMSPPPPEKGKKIFLERLPWIWKRLPFMLKMVCRDILRNPFRSTVSFLAGVVATALVLSALCMRDGLKYLMRYEYQLVARQDSTVTFREPRGRGFDAEVRQGGGISGLEPQLNVAADISNGVHRKRISITGIAPGNHLYTPLDASKQPIHVPKNGVVLTKKLAEILHLKVGDKATFQPLIAERRTATVTVVATIDSYVGLSAYADLEYLSRLLGEEWVANSLLTKSYGGVRNTALMADLKEMPTVVGVGERLRSLTQIEETFGKANATIIGIFVIFAALIGFGSVLNASLVSLSERQREVGTLRVLGYTPREVAQLFAIESWILFGSGIVVGLWAGYQYVQILSVLYSSELFRFPAIVLPERYLHSVIIMALCVFAAQLIVFRLVKNLNWLEVLKIKE